jgi:hypothetical protein
VVGDQALVADTIAAYRRAGVDVPVVFPLTWGAASQDVLESTPAGGDGTGQPGNVRRRIKPASAGS